ncbi:Ubiquinone biosynthesis O-methyltransferase,S-adenosyl-L-methionine-dependent methyltransferase [Cinara cedri]|uniref:Ubiquinone biosynthesis O-methyltransferase, mitochondrial n=1 Tax=Cinara cedri TaxID=506608 RepID=A0A5E4NKY6_9HEMI|nr:Ubiquinone biosynthesis O-methyltransferase,S-adenosyl-L-methionine-dependent methyltransferase [Cinara cedri]
MFIFNANINSIIKKTNISISINIFRSITQNHVKETVNSQEVEHHSNMKEFWWKSNGPLNALHSLNPLRVSFIINGLVNMKKIETENIGTRQSLKNIKILDVGCGGGLLTEALARLDSNVTGIDPSKDLISIAIDHSVILRNKKIKYINESIEEHVKLNAETYDAIVTSEVLEHVSNKYSFLTSCAECLKPGGSLFITTPNRTLSSWLSVIIIGETFNFIPKGTHEWEKFICPHELQSILEMNCKCDTISINGLSYEPFTNHWCWTNLTDVSYAIHAVKNNSTI